MELANKGMAQATELYRSMTPAARISAGLLLLVAAVSVAYLFRQPLEADDTYLMGGQAFSQGELQAMQAAFGKAGLEAELDGARMRIPRGQESKYMAALDDADALPATFGHNMQAAVNTSGFLRIPQRQQEAKWRVAKQQDLQRLIEDMRGIDRAAVMLDEELIDEFRRPERRLTSAVTVFPTDDQPLDLETVRTIRQLMVSSISGLEAQAVTVVDMSQNRSFAGDDAAVFTGGTYAAEKQRLESQWKASVAELLSYIPDVRISTHVELEPADDANGDHHGGAVRRVTASVAVPSSYYEQLWYQKQPKNATNAGNAPTQDALAHLESREKQKIEQLVSNLLPKDASPTDAERRVAVSTVYPLAAEVSPRARIRQLTRAWLVEHWQKIGLAVFGLAGLLVLRRMFRSIDAPPRKAAAQQEEPPVTISVPGEPQPQPASAMAGPHFARSGIERSSLRTELANAVREDPDAAVNVLRSWIGNAN